MPDQNCEECGETYYVKPSKSDRSKYCSRECFDESQKNRTTLTCEFCEETYEKKKSHAAESRFCSRECKDRFKRTYNEWRETVHCATCGADLKRERYETKRHKHHFCDDTCRGEWISKNRRGKDAPNWQGGATLSFGSRWPQVRKRVFDRDRVCQYCGEDGTETYLDVHHIVPRREFEVVDDANTLVNLVLLCRSCHKRAEHRSIVSPRPGLPDLNLSDRIEIWLEIVEWVWTDSNRRPLPCKGSVITN